MKIEIMQASHWPEVRQVYLEGIATGQATFQTDAPSWDDWDSSHLAGQRYVAMRDNLVLGWAALSHVSSRCVYAGVAEVSIYIGAQYRGEGIGLKLLTHLIHESEQQDFWTLQAGIFSENTASLRLHRKTGFRVIGTREKVAKHHGVWRDVCVLERRSKVAGTD